VSRPDPVRPLSEGVVLPAAVLPDAAPGQILTRLAPPAFLPFIQLARLDRPIGWWLLLLPCWWSSALASVAQAAPPHLAHLVLFLIGAIAMRGAGSTYNDLVDREIDAKVARTKARPLPAGRVGVRAAKIFLVAQSMVGAAVLVSFNGFSIGLGLVSLLVVAIYPFMKRVTSWPQACLGLAFAWGGLMGWSCALGGLAWPALLLYVGAVFWTIGYDTIYALQDIADDSIVGIRSTARFFGPQVRLAVALLFAAAVVAIAGALLFARVGGGLAWAGVLGFALHLAWQVKTIDPQAPYVALRLFRSNRDAGLILFVGLAAQALLAAAR